PCPRTTATHVSGLAGSFDSAAMQAISRGGDMEMAIYPLSLFAFVPLRLCAPSPLCLSASVPFFRARPKYRAYGYRSNLDVALRANAMAVESSVEKIRSKVSIVFTIRTFEGTASCKSLVRWELYVLSDP